MMKSAGVLVALAACLWLSTSPLLAASITEASGLAYHNGTLYVVGDNDHGAVFTTAFDSLAEGLLPLDSARLTRHVLKGAQLARDLEAVEVLPDGRLLVLSEDLACLLVGDVSNDSDFVVACQYPGQFNEFGNCGLEGLAVRALDSGLVQIAAVWEGGHANQSMVPTACLEMVGRRLRPVAIFSAVPVADLGRRPVGDRRTADMQRPEHETSGEGSPAYRIPDLVMHSWHDSTSGADSTVQGVIAIVASILYTPNEDYDGLSPQDRFRYHWLQRYRLDGHPYGRAVELDSVLSLAVASRSDELLRHPDGAVRSSFVALGSSLDEGTRYSVNWEGLCWLRPGVTLAMVYDKDPKDPPFVLAFRIPEAWR